MAHDHVMYPEVLPAGCVVNVTRILRDRKMLEEKKDFALDAWNIIGYGQRLLIGVPAGDEFSSVPASVMMRGCEASVAELSECSRCLQAAIDEEGGTEEHDPSPARFGAKADKAALNPAVIALLMQYGPMLLKIIKDLIAKKQSALEGPKHAE